MNLIAETKLDLFLNIIWRQSIQGLGIPQGKYWEGSALTGQESDVMNLPSQGSTSLTGLGCSHQLVYSPPFGQLRNSIEGFDEISKGNKMYVI